MWKISSAAVKIPSKEEEKPSCQHKRPHEVIFHMCRNAAGALISGLFAAVHVCLSTGTLWQLRKLFEDFQEGQPRPDNIDKTAH